MSTDEGQIRQLREEVHRLRAELRELQQRQAAGTGPPGPISRRGLLLGAGAAMGAAAAGLIGSSTSPALATDGSAVIAGQDNTDAAAPTGIVGSVLTAPAMRVSNFYSGPYDNYSDGLQAYTYGAGFAAVYGRNDASGGTSIEGLSASGVSLYAAGGGRLRQDANLAAGPPTYAPSAFEQVRDGNGVLWISDAQGAWRRLNTLVPIKPVRVLDSRISPGALPFGNTLTLTIAGTNGIPASAVGIVGNLTATSPAQPGFLAIYPGGTAYPGTSNLNFIVATEVDYAIANSVTAALGTGASAGTVTIYANGLSGGSVYVILDLFAYIQ